MILSAHSACSSFPAQETRTDVRVNWGYLNGLESAVEYLVKYWTDDWRLLKPLNKYELAVTLKGLQETLKISFSDVSVWPIIGAKGPKVYNICHERHRQLAVGQFECSRDSFVKNWIKHRNEACLLPFSLSETDCIVMWPGYIMDMGHGDTVQIAAKKIKIEVGKLLSKSKLVSGTEQKNKLATHKK